MGEKAMDTYHVVLYVRLLSLFIGIGAGSVLLVCLFQLRGVRTLEQAAPWGMAAGKVGKYLPVAILGLFATDAYMTSHFWTWGTSWIVFAILALVLLGAQGAGIAEHTAKKLQAAMRANGPKPLGPDAQRMHSIPASGWSSCRTSASSSASSGT
jgi:hypothetical protein